MTCDLFASRNFLSVRHGNGALLFTVRYSPLATTVIIAATFALRSSQPIDGVVIARAIIRATTSAFFSATIVMREAGGYHQ